MLVLEKAIIYGERGSTLQELANAVGRKPGNLRRKAARPSDAPKGPVDKLLEANLLLEGYDGRLRVPHNLAWLLSEELKNSGCVAAKAADARRYAEERRAFRTRGQRPPNEGPSKEALAEGHAERVELSMNAFLEEGYGPQKALHAYIDGVMTTFDHLVRAVAYRYGVVDDEGGIGEGWVLWKPAVSDAYALYMGEVRS